MFVRDILCCIFQHHNNYKVWCDFFWMNGIGFSVERGSDAEIVRLYGEQVGPLQERLDGARGQLVAARTCYFPYTQDPFPETAWHVGVVGEKTMFPSIEGVRFTESFLLDVTNPVKLRASGGWTSQGNSFHAEGVSIAGLVSFRGRPHSPQNNLYNGGVGRVGVVFPATYNPSSENRLSMFFGDDEVVGVLSGATSLEGLPGRQGIEGWQYLQLGGLLERSLPMSEAMQGRIYDEQVGLVREVMEIHGKIENLSGNVERARRNPMHDDVSIALQFNGSLEDLRTNLRAALKRGRQRGYHTMGQIVLPTGSLQGVRTTVDLGELFAPRA